MNRKQRCLLQRQQLLISQTALQRLNVCELIQPWQTPLALADQGLTALRLIRVHPALMVGSTVVMSVIGPGRFGKWVWRGLLGWRIYQQYKK